MPINNHELSAKQKVALDIMKTIGEPSGVLRIFQACPGSFDSKTQLKAVLGQLCTLQRLKHQSNGQYKLVEQVTPTPRARESAPKKAVKKTVKTAAKPSLEREADNDPIVAIERLAQRIHQDPVVIADADLKLAVLEKLGAILEPSITEVLEQIMQDITSVRNAVQP